MWASKYSKEALVCTLPLQLLLSYYVGFPLTSGSILWATGVKVGDSPGSLAGGLNAGDHDGNNVLWCKLVSGGDFILCGTRYFLME